MDNIIPATKPTIQIVRIMEDAETSYFFSHASDPICRQALHVWSLHDLEVLWSALGDDLILYTASVGDSLPSVLEVVMLPIADTRRILSRMQSGLLAGDASPERALHQYILVDSELLPIDGDLYKSLYVVVGNKLINKSSQENSRQDREERGTAVNHPNHYNNIPIECIDVVRYFNFNRGNAIKYIWRAGLKDKAKEIEDLEKAIFYLNDEIKALKKSKE